MCGRRRICCISRHRPASNVKSAEKFSIVPATGLHSESSWLSQQVFRRVPSKQGTSRVSSFLNFLSSVSGCAKCTPKLAFTPDGRPYCCAHSSARPEFLSPSLVIPNGFTVRKICFAGSSPALAPRKFPMWKSSGNPEECDD